MTNILFVLLLLGTSSVAVASTFVGNGGSIFDTEIRATIKSLKESVRAAPNDPSPCHCEGDSKQCAILRDLSNEQVLACKTFIRETSDDFLQLLDRSSEFRFELSSGGIQLEGKSGRFDAAASSQSNLIILDEDRFAKITSTDRVQLLGHEFLHFLEYQGKRLGDAGNQGPFVGAEGGRQFLDTIAAAYVIIGMRAKEIPLTDSSLSRPFTNLYFHIQVGRRDLSRKDRKESLFDKKVDTESRGVTWFPRESENLGWSIEHYIQNGKRTTDLESKISMSAVNVGPVYRLLPFETGKIWLDSWQLWGTIKLGYGNVKHTLKDSYVSLSDTASMPLVSGGLSLQLPLAWNFWMLLSAGGLYSPYHLEKLNIRSRSLDGQTSIGVSYGLQI